MRRFLFAYGEPVVPKSSFHRAVEFFTAWVDLGTAAFLTEVGTGTSREMEELLDHTRANLLEAKTSLSD